MAKKCKGDSFNQERFRHVFFVNCQFSIVNSLQTFLNMKLTPIEIRQKQFNKRTLGGIDRDEVDAFLVTVSQAYEKLLEENHQLKERLAGSQQEVTKLREIESSLYKTLKTAEDTGANLVDQARQAATLQLREADLRGETVLKEARWQAKSVLDEAKQEVKRIYDKLYSEVGRLEEECRQTERQRDSLLADLLNLANEVVQKVERNQVRTHHISFGEAMQAAPPEIKLTPALEAALRDTPISGPATALPSLQPASVSVPEGSFFDTL
jgi:cell division initiation protein